jgi:hypothetical protein
MVSYTSRILLYPGSTVLFLLSIILLLGRVLLEGTVNTKVLSSRKQRQKEDRIGESQPFQERTVSAIRPGCESKRPSSVSFVGIFFCLFSLPLSLSFFFSLSPSLSLFNSFLSAYPSQFLSLSLSFFLFFSLSFSISFQFLSMCLSFSISLCLSFFLFFSLSFSISFQFLSMCLSFSISLSLFFYVGI